MGRRIRGARLTAVQVLVVFLIIGLWLVIRSGYWELDWLRLESPALTSVDQAWRNGQSKVWVEVEGEVERILQDDLDGSRHQRFIIRIPSGLTILIAHNIDLASRVAVEKGDKIRVRGLYEWNKKGGLIHWTHQDPEGNIEGGWVFLQATK